MSNEPERPVDDPGRPSGAGASAADDALGRAYRAADTPAPPDWLDANILAAARSAPHVTRARAQGETGDSPRVSRQRERWVWPWLPVGGTLATVLVAMLLVTARPPPERDDVAESATRSSAAAPAAAPAATAPAAPPSAASEPAASTSNSTSAAPAAAAAAPPPAAPPVIGMVEPAPVRRNTEAETRSAAPNRAQRQETASAKTREAASGSAHAPKPLARGEANADARSAVRAAPEPPPRAAPPASQPPASQPPAAPMAQGPAPAPPPVAIPNQSPAAIPNQPAPGAGAAPAQPPAAAFKTAPTPFPASPPSSPPAAASAPAPAAATSPAPARASPPSAAISAERARASESAREATTDAARDAASDAATNAANERRDQVSGVDRSKAAQERPAAMPGALSSTGRLNTAQTPQACITRLEELLRENRADEARRVLASCRTRLGAFELPPALKRQLEPDTR